MKRFQKIKDEGDVVSRKIIINWLKKIDKKENVKILNAGSNNFDWFNKEVFKQIGQVSEFWLTDINIDETKENNSLIFKKKVDLSSYISFDDNYFDYIIATGILEHIYNTDLFIRELNRILKDNGILIILTSNMSAIQYRLLLLVGKQPTCLHPSMKSYNTPIEGHILTNIYYKHVSCFTYDGLKKFLLDNGFKMEYSTTNYIYFMPNSISNIITHFLNWGIFSIFITKKTGLPQSFKLYP